jgi:hypothetical protein
VIESLRRTEHVSAEAAGTLVAFLDTGALESRRYLALRRLRQLHASDHFERLPADLQQRIRDLVEVAPTKP